MNKPNMIIILTDDQGYGDLSCMGSKDIRTPNLDRLAASGARFESMYSNSPVCSPSRAALLTGRYPANAGIRSILGGRRSTTGLTPETPTLATALKEQGYNTAAMGKWHLGSEPQARPLSNGFDTFFGFHSGCIDYYSHIFYWGMDGGGMDPIHDLWEDETEVHADGEYFTELITERSVNYIREQEADQPFFLYAAYNAPHYPMHAPQRYLDRFAHLPHDRRIMAAMLSAVDDGVGEICDELERKDMLDNTIICFLSDNGPSRESRNHLDGTTDPYYGGSTGGFRGHKFSLFEGGIRVPGIISWPARIPADQVITAPVAAMDIFPTLLLAADGDPEDYALDGLDISPVLLEGADSPHEYLYWEMGRQSAVRFGVYKLVLNGQEVEFEQPKEPIFLSNLEADPSEQHNLIDEEPELAEHLRVKVEAWLRSIG